MKRKLIFFISLLGVMGALLSAYLFSIPFKAEPPAFNPTQSPFKDTIYANGIIESDQSSGENINLNFEVTGVVNRIFIHEGDSVKKGDPLVAIDDTVQKNITDEQRQQAAAALGLLQELKAQPRPENLEVSKAQIEVNRANLKLAQDQYDKLKGSEDLMTGSVSKDVLDNALNAIHVASANLNLAQRQYDLIKAGAWSYDIQTQEKQYKALSAAAESSAALLRKFTLKAPNDGVVLMINVAEGSYVSGSGIYDTYTGSNLPAVVMGSKQENLGVRCYIDEILLNRLPARDHIHAEMAIRGTNTRIPLEFVRIQPYVSPKIQLSDQRQERVDVRVLPVIFRFANKPDRTLYPGQLVDIYIKEK